MLKQLKFALIAVFAIGMISACGGGDKDVREEAAQSLTEANDATVQPAVNAAAEPVGPTTVITFEETEFDFGTVTEGEKVSHTFKFTNTGENDLIVTNARGSCGCTVPSKPERPIAPGATGEITVQFDSKNKVGDRRQKVTIDANTQPAQTFIYLVGKVEKGAEATQ